MTIKEIFDNFDLSVRAYNVCKDNDINNAAELKSYYLKNGTFYNLRNCGKKSNKELINICNKYTNDHTEISFIITKNLITELTKNQHEIINNFINKKTKTLSNRSKNAINKYLRRDLNLENFGEKILFRQQFDVSQLKNIGVKSISELTIYISEIREFIFSIVNVQNIKHLTEKNKVNYMISNLTRLQKTVMDSFIFTSTTSLSARSKNVLTLYLSGNYNIKNFGERILLSENFNAHQLKNIGKKCIPEIQNYVASVKEFLITLSETRDENHLNSLKNNFLIQKTYSIGSLPKEIEETDSIFTIVNFLLNRNAFYKSKETTILKEYLKIYQNHQPFTLDEVALRAGITKERARQIVKNRINTLFDKLLFIKNINDNLSRKYGIDLDGPYIDLTPESIAKINTLSNTNFSKEFIIFILSVYVDDKFTTIGNIEDVLTKKRTRTAQSYKWNNLFLISKELSSEYMFEKLVNDIEYRLNERIEESYSFYFKSYLSKFLRNGNIEILNQILPIAENIINKELQLYLDIDESLTFNKNVIKQVYEYAFEALEKLKKPSTVKEIFNKVMEDFPNYNTSEDSLRASMKRSRGFVPIGRKSVYGLKKWEGELENFKGGTIREIIRTYLHQFDEPKHIDTITKHVIQFRPKTNSRSIHTSLKMDQTKVFHIFSKGYVGLKGKTYIKKYEKLYPVVSYEKKSWEDQFETLKNFVLKTQRTPLSNGVPVKEIKLHRWLNIQKRKLKEGRLEVSKVAKLNSLLKTYPSTKNSLLLRAKEKYRNLIAFISINNRLPKPNKNGEGSLYQFFYNQRKLFEKDDLDSYEKLKFMEVIKLLQKIKYENKRN